MSVTIRAGQRGKGGRTVVVRRVRLLLIRENEHKVRVSQGKAKVRSRAMRDLGH